MSELNQEQKQAVISWVEAGESLSSIQEKIQSEFGLAMTYMEVRFLIDDLGVEFKKTEEEEPGPGDEVSTEDAVVEPEPVEDAVVGKEGAGGVQVDVDKVQRPGAVVSGNVTFSDGRTAQWQIDQMGRLGIVPPKEGYQPPESDLSEFQTKIQQALQEQGF